MRTILGAIVVAVLALGGCGFEISAAPGSELPDASAPSSQCGDAIVQGGEECDDGNASAGDGCDACLIEPAWACPSGTACVQVTGLMFSPQEPLATAGSSNGGTAFSHPCAAGAAIIGFQGDSSDGVTDIGHLRASCAPVSFAADGRLTWSTIQNTAYQGNENAGALGTTKCANDSIVVGYTANAGLYLSGFELVCLPVSFVHGVLGYGPTTTLTMFGPATQQVQPTTQCAAGEAATFYEGRSGAVFDHFNLRCAAMTPITR
jgi:cysteine-rich repeat protein